jgi:protein-disulfide isomerase
MNDRHSPVGRAPEGLKHGKRNRLQALGPIGWLLGLVALVLAGQAGLRALSLPGAALERSPALEALWADRNSPAIGPGQAPIQILVFTDYQCAACKADHDEVAAVARSETARFVFKEWAILGPASTLAARAALAARYQGRYDQMRDALMRGPGPPNRANILVAARRAGVDPTRLQSDARTYEQKIDQEIARVSRQAFSLGLRGTPAYLIGRRLVVGSISAGQLRRLIAHEAEDASKPLS